MTEKVNGIPAAVRLHEALAAAGLPVAGVGRDRETGAVRVDWSEPPSKMQEEQAQAVIAYFTHKPTRMERMAQAGFGTERLLEALWEQVVERDGTLVEEIKKAM